MVHNFLFDCNLGNLNTEGDDCQQPENQIRAPKQLLTAGKKLLNKIIKETIIKSEDNKKKMRETPKKRYQARLLQSQKFKDIKTPLEVKPLSPMAKPNYNIISKSYKSLSDTKGDDGSNSRYTRPGTSRFSRIGSAARKRPMTSVSKFII